MSHFTTVKTELRNLDALAAALRRAGYDCRPAGTVADFYGKKRKVDLVVNIPNQRTVGFVRNPQDGLLELVGDWYGGALGREQFLDSIKCSYAREQVMASLASQGIDLADVRETEEDDGTVVFEVPIDDGQVQALAADE